MKKTKKTKSAMAKMMKDKPKEIVLPHNKRMIVINRMNHLT